MAEAPRNAHRRRSGNRSAEHADLADRILQRAKSHHRAASAVSGEPDIADFVIGFHAHQAVEHSLVAVLAGAGRPLPRTHELDRIVRLLAERGLVTPRAVASSGWLNPWAVRARYEDIGTALDRPRAIETATLALDWATRLIAPHSARDPSRAAGSDMLPLPPGWDRTIDGEPMPDIVAAVRRSRADR